MSTSQLNEKPTSKDSLNTNSSTVESWRVALPFRLPGFATKFAPDPKILSRT
jgi:hypothetical protein